MLTNIQLRKLPSEDIVNNVNVCVQKWLEKIVIVKLVKVYKTEQHEY